jgi:hypothetical protein
MTDAGSELARAALVATLAPVLGNGSAGRCSELLLTHGVSTVPDDWKLLERADRRLAWCVLQELKEQVGLTTMQLARVQLLLRGETGAVALVLKPRPEARVSQVARVAVTSWPLFSVFRKYALGRSVRTRRLPRPVANIMEILFLFSNTHQWLAAVYDALDGQQLRDAFFGQVETTMLVSSLFLGGILALFIDDLEALALPDTAPLHIINLTLSSTAFLLAFETVLLTLYMFHIYMPIPVHNLRNVLRATRSLPMTAGLTFAISAWLVFWLIVFQAARPLVQHVDWWLFRPTQLGTSALVMPVIFLLALLANAVPHFLVQITATARLVAHSGALGSWQVLPNEAERWSATQVKRRLAEIANSNPDLKQMYLGNRDEATSTSSTTSKLFGFESVAPISQSSGGPLPHRSFIIGRASRGATSRASGVLSASM